MYCTVYFFPPIQALKLGADGALELIFFIGKYTYILLDKSKIICKKDKDKKKAFRKAK